MVLKLNINDTNFPCDFEAFLNISRSPVQDISSQVQSVLSDIRKRGDEALLEYTKKWDNLVCQNAKDLRLTMKQVDDIACSIPAHEMVALKLAHERISAYHKQQLPQNYETTDNVGVKLGWRWTAVDAVGLYVPGGSAAYPSSVLMNAIPAQVAGVERIVVVTPPGQLNPLVVAALKLCGIKEIYTIGGAQAIAALTYGTQTIKSVDMITGPGNAFVAEAKRQVFGIVGIDMVAGPSEILVIADENANPEWLAADLLSQAEHDVVAQSILITSSQEVADKTEGWVQKHLQNLERADIARKSWQDFGAIIIVDNLEQACELSNKIAPEHLEVMTKNPEALLGKCKHAGSIFLGAFTPEALGDYLAGPNHVLPTTRSARFSSGLGVLNFMKRTSYIQGSQASANQLHEAVGILADGEKLGAHALSARLRMNQRENK
ncbi:MAG: histidinol dehydrogenase [Alphaproteobacteria bacterium]